MLGNAWVYLYNQLSNLHQVYLHTRFISCSKRQNKFPLSLCQNAWLRDSREQASSRIPRWHSHHWEEMLPSHKKEGRKRLYRGMPLRSMLLLDLWNVLLDCDPNSETSVLDVLSLIFLLFCVIIYCKKCGRFYYNVFKQPVRYFIICLLIQSYTLPFFRLFYRSFRSVFSIISTYPMSLRVGSVVWIHS